MAQGATVTTSGPNASQHDQSTATSWAIDTSGNLFLYDIKGTCVGLYASGQWQSVTDDGSNLVVGTVPDPTTPIARIQPAA